MRQHLYSSSDFHKLQIRQRSCWTKHSAQGMETSPPLRAQRGLPRRHRQIDALQISHSQLKQARGDGEGHWASTAGFISKFTTLFFNTNRTVLFKVPICLTQDTLPSIPHRGDREVFLSETEVTATGQVVKKSSSSAFAFPSFLFNSSIFWSIDKKPKGVAIILRSMQWKKME